MTYAVRSKHDHKIVIGGFGNKEHAEKFIREHLEDPRLDLYEAVPDQRGYPKSGHR